MVKSIIAEIIGWFLILISMVALVTFFSSDWDIDTGKAIIYILIGIAILGLNNDTKRSRYAK